MTVPLEPHAPSWCDTLDHVSVVPRVKRHESPTQVLHTALQGWPSRKGSITQFVLILAGSEQQHYSAVLYSSANFRASTRSAPGSSKPQIPCADCVCHTRLSPALLYPRIAAAVCSLRAILLGWHQTRQTLCGNCCFKSQQLAREKG